MTNDEGLDQDLMVEVWRVASGITHDRPWLLASWSDNTPNIPHLVVHDGAHGAALHFDHEDGPYWSGGFTRRMTWADVASDDEPEEWAMGWGERGPTRRVKGKAAAYTLLSSLSARWVVSRVSWVVRPAPILADSPDSVFALAELFPTAAESVHEYLEVIERNFQQGEETGVPAYWHEPIWVVRRNGQPRLLVDEAGVAHLPVTADFHGTSIDAPRGMSLAAIVARKNLVTNRARAGYRFDIREALVACGGSDELATLCDRGVLAVIWALEPEIIAPEPVEPDAVEPQPAEDPVVEPTERVRRDHWGWTYGGEDYVLAALNRSNEPEALDNWHRRERVRRHRIARAFDPEDPTPRLVREAIDEGLLDPEDQRPDRLRWAIETHLQRNLLPAVPLSMVDACLTAIRLAENDASDELVELPPEVTFADQYGAPIATHVAASEVIRQHSLSDFIWEPLLHNNGATVVAHALAAWQKADAGTWELPSPAPAWPEYVTVLLLGRNHLVPGVEDEPSEQDDIRQWGSTPGGWDWTYAEPWSSDQTRRSMNLPGPDRASGTSRGGVEFPMREEDSLTEKERDEAGGFSLVAGATFNRLLEILDRAADEDDPTTIFELFLAGGIASKYAGHLSLDELSVDLQRRAASSWRETRRLLFREDDEV